MLVNKMDKTTLRHMVFRNPAYFIAFGFGSGLMSVAPGTWGTLAAIPLYCLMMYLSPLHYSLVVVAAFFLGIYVCHVVSCGLGEHDYSGIVWDEVVGYWITMWMIPPSFIAIVVGFCLFRLFDIWKPFPIRWVDKRVKGGLGIMLDDVLAAIPACVIMKYLFG